ncbi:hypothetical protein CEXT_382141 [Caerostris extrusa]|uniref:Uncharacterized protein n=1 Tax=Caerostris extrusa TaxID=172846 RepID=A0AAV4VIC1_CAEEX|nr:hypothetical protein CEXT_382141 [Caerostris extrusa]
MYVYVPLIFVYSGENRVKIDKSLIKFSKPQDLSLLGNPRKFFIPKGSAVPTRSEEFFSPNLISSSYPPVTSILVLQSFEQNKPWQSKNDL